MTSRKNIIQLSNEKLENLIRSFYIIIMIIGSTLTIIGILCDLDVINCNNIVKYLGMTIFLISILLICDENN